MKGGVATALAIGVGYILGRRRKMRLATMLAAGAATGGAAKLGPAALRQGTKYLGKTDIAGALGPQVTEIVNTVRGELLDAAKGAATAAVTSRIDSLSDNLHDRAETLRNPEAAVDKAGETVGRAGKTAGRAGETVGRATGLRRRRREADVEDEVEDEAEPDLDGEERGNGRVRRKRSRASEEPADEASEEPADEYEDEDEEEDEDEGPADEADEPEEEEAEEPAPRRRRTTRSPVVRARR
jgi:hypothetical protein